MARPRRQGQCGVGGVYLLTLARLGIGAFSIAEFDTYALANFNRQIGATVSSLNRPKVDVMLEMARDINPQLDVRVFRDGLNAENIGDFLDGGDVYVDGDLADVVPGRSVKGRSGEPAQALDRDRRATLQRRRCGAGAQVGPAPWQGRRGAGRPAFRCLSQPPQAHLAPRRQPQPDAAPPARTGQAPLAVAMSNRPPEWQALQRILGAGLMAPSADNRHALRFQIDDDTVRLLSTDAATWPAQPHRRMLALLSCGAVIENMALRSAELGLALTADLWPDAARQDHVADLRWVDALAQPDRLAQAIALRHTNRRFYRRTALSAQTLAELSAAAAAAPGAQVRWLDNGADRSLALRAPRIAETERFRRRALHQKLFDAVRFDIGWQRSTDEGLPPAALQIERPMRGMFSLLRHWPLMRVANALGAHHLLGLRAAYLPCALAPHLGLMLAGAPSEPLAAVQAGRSFQRLWLAAAAAGLQPYLYFRLGHAPAPTLVSKRLPLDRYIA
jgi:hypothetical protein